MILWWDTVLWKERRGREIFSPTGGGSCSAAEERYLTGGYEDLCFWTFCADFQFGFAADFQQAKIMLSRFWNFRFDRRQVSHQVSHQRTIVR